MIDRANAFGTVALLGLVACSDDPPADDDSRIAFNRTMRSGMEARGMSWTYWEFAAGFGVYNPTTLSFRQGLLESLIGG